MIKPLLLSLALTLGLTQISTAQEKEQQPSTQQNKPGYLNITEFNIGRGFKNQNTAWSAGLQTINGFQFNELISAGIGIGVERFIHENIFEGGLTATPIFMPVFTDVRVYLSKGSVQPFLGQDLGYMFCLYQPDFEPKPGYYNNVGGLLINPFIGVKTNFKSGNALSFSIGYRYQEESVKNVPYYNYSEFSPDYFFIINKYTWFHHFITFKTGLTF